MEETTVPMKSGLSLWGEIEMQSVWQNSTQEDTISERTI
jgi:hypothetical protein